MFDVKMSALNASHTNSLQAIYTELSCTPYSVPTASSNRPPAAVQEPRLININE